MKNKCDCGSAKCGHPGHSHWCSSLKEDIGGYDLSAALEALQAALNVGAIYSYQVNSNIQTNHSPNGNVAYNPSLPIYATPNPATPSHVFQVGDMVRYKVGANGTWSSQTYLIQSIRFINVIVGGVTTRNNDFTLQGVTGIDFKEKDLQYAGVSVGPIPAITLYNPLLAAVNNPHVFQVGDMARYPLPNNCGWSHAEKIYNVARGIGRNGEDLIYFLLNMTMMVFHASELMFVPPTNQTVQNAP